MEEIIRAWKTDGEALEPHLPASPVGQELSEEELLEISGGEIAPVTCTVTCLGTCNGGTCPNTCAVTG
jgi:mersacidin/lichenicidin family type 2 lantibiotic